MVSFSRPERRQHASALSFSSSGADSHKATEEEFQGLINEEEDTCNARKCLVEPRKKTVEYTNP